MEDSYFIIVPTYCLTKVTHRSAILFGTIISLSRRTGECYASNAALCDMALTTPHQLARDLKELEDNGLITREVVRNDRKEVVARYIRPTLSANLQVPPLKSQDTLPLDFAGTPPHKTHGNNSIKDNTISDKNNYTMEFENAWKNYLKVGSKFTAYKAWSKLSKATQDKVAIHITEFVNQHRKAGKIDFLPHFSTYLNQRRWEDEVLPYQQTPQTISWV